MGFFSDLWDDVTQGVQDVADWFTGKDQSDANKQAINDTNAANIAMARETNAMAQALAQQNFAFQREFAESGIQKRIQDAKSAGIHPLYAIGANTPSVSPVAAAFDTPQSQAPVGNHMTGFDLAKQVIGATASINSMRQQQIANREVTARVEQLNSQTKLNRARRDEVLARMSDSIESRNKQNLNYTGNGRIDPEFDIEDLVKYDPRSKMIELKPITVRWPNPDGTWSVHRVVPEELRERYLGEAGSGQSWTSAAQAVEKNLGQRIKEQAKDWRSYSKVPLNMIMR